MDSKIGVEVRSFISDKKGRHRDRKGVSRGKLGSLQKARNGRKTDRKSVVLGSSVSDSPSSVCTSTTAESPSSVCTSLGSLDMPVLTGCSCEEFVEMRRDFRWWGSRTHHEFISSGWRDNLLQALHLYEVTRNKEIGHQYIVFVDELPLNLNSAVKLKDMEIHVSEMLTNLGPSHDVVGISKMVARKRKSATLIRQWTLQFMHNEGFFHGVGYKKREMTGLIADMEARHKMKTWMLHSLKQDRPATAKDFIGFVHAHFGVEIQIRTAQIWLHSLGFVYKPGTKQEVYYDGHQRTDVKRDLKGHVSFMQDLMESCITYTGVGMDEEVRGARLVDPLVQRVVVSFHDECAAHATEGHTLCWRFPGSGGKLKNKSRGPCVMVAAYVCAEVGMWENSTDA